MAIRIAAGKKSTMPKLKERQMGITSDTEEVYVGTASKNLHILDEKDKSELTAQLAEKAQQTELIKTKESINSANLRIDGLVIQSGNANVEVTDAHVSTSKNKTFTTINNRFEEIEENTSIMVTNEVKNGDFTDVSRWTPNNSNIEVVNGRLQITAKGQWATIGQSIPTIIGDKYYVSVQLEGTTNNYIEFVTPKYKTVVENEKLSFITTAKATSHILQIGDKNISNWLPYYADKVLVVNVSKLSIAYNNGVDLTVEQIEKLLSQFTNSWFDGTKNLFFAKNTLKRIDSLEKTVGSIISLPPLPTEGKKLLVFGDSITETATISDDGATYTEGTSNSWVTYTKQSLKIGEMWNYAKSGASYKSWSSILRQRIAHQITTAINNNRPADIIVVSAGTNDGADLMGDYATAMSKTSLGSLDMQKTYEAIRWAFWTLRQNYPDAECFVVTPLQRADREPISILSDAIKQMARRYNFIIIDAENESGIIKDFEVWQGEGRYLKDGLHPKTSGQIKMAKLINKSILNHLNNLL